MCRTNACLLHSTVARQVKVFAMQLSWQTDRQAHRHKQKGSNDSQQNTHTSVCGCPSGMINLNLNKRTICNNALFHISVWMDKSKRLGKGLCQTSAGDHFFWFKSMYRRHLKWIHLSQPYLHDWQEKDSCDHIKSSKWCQFSWDRIRNTNLISHKKSCQLNYEWNEVMKK